MYRSVEQRNIIHISGAEEYHHINHIFCQLPSGYHSWLLPRLGRDGAMGSAHWEGAFKPGLGFYMGFTLQTKIDVDKPYGFPRKMINDSKWSGFLHVSLHKKYVWIQVLSRTKTLMQAQDSVVTSVVGNLDLQSWHVESEECSNPCWLMIAWSYTII